MTVVLLREQAAELNPDMLFFDGLDEAFVGVAERPGTNPVACYSVKKMVQVLKNEGMSEDEAREYLEFNTLGAYMGEDTPMVLWD